VADIERVYRETFILTSLKHPNVIKLYEVCRFSVAALCFRFTCHVSYATTMISFKSVVRRFLMLCVHPQVIDTSKAIMLVMEYADGGELFDYIAARSRLGEQVCSSLLSCVICFPSVRLFCSQSKPGIFSSASFPFTLSHCAFARLRESFFPGGVPRVSANRGRRRLLPPQKDYSPRPEIGKHPHESRRRHQDCRFRSVQHDQVWPKDGNRVRNAIVHGARDGAISFCLSFTLLLSPRPRIRHSDPFSLVFTDAAQIQNKQYAGSSVDLWALGVILYATVCGFLPFEAKSAPALYKKIVKGSVVIPDFLSRSCRELIASCLCTDPEKRFDIGRVRAHAWLAMDEHGSGVRDEVDALAPVTDAHIAAANAANLVQSGDVPATGRVLSQRREAKAAQQAGAGVTAAAAVTVTPVAATAEAAAPALVAAAAASGTADSDDEDEVHRPPVSAASNAAPLASSASSASLSLPPSASSSFSRAGMSSAARRPASSMSASASASPATVVPASPNALSQPPSPLLERPAADSRLLEFDVDEFDSNANATASSLSSSASHAALAHALPLASGSTSQTVFALGSPSNMSATSSSGSHAGPITAFPSGQPRPRSVSLTTTNSGGSVGGIGIGLNLMGLGASVGASVGARVGVGVGVGGGGGSGGSGSGSAAPLVRRSAVATDRYVWM
jgi:serine/threonine protein kinase